MLVAMLGIAAGFTVIAYSAMFQALYFLQTSLHVAPLSAQLIVGGSAMVGMGAFIFFGWLSDRVGRRKPIIIGYALLLLLLMPVYQLMGSAANPGLYDSAERAPVVVSGADCGFDPFAKVQSTACGRLLDHLSRLGVPYDKAEGDHPAVTIAGTPVADLSAEELDAALRDNGYDLAPVTPDWLRATIFFFAPLVMWGLSGAPFGPVPAPLSAYLPTAITPPRF